MGRHLDERVGAQIYLQKAQDTEEINEFHGRHGDHSFKAASAADQQRFDVCSRGKTTKNQYLKWANKAAPTRQECDLFQNSLCASFIQDIKKWLAAASS